ncbi:MAG: hypothetical protein AB1Z98_09205 [Nannocystaceae bacterium]
MGAGLAATLIGATYFVDDFVGRRAALGLDWDVMLPVLFVYVLLVGVLGGVGVGLGLDVAVRLGASRPSAARVGLPVLVGVLFAALVVGIVGVVLFSPGAAGRQIDFGNALRSIALGNWAYFVVFFTTSSGSSGSASWMRRCIAAVYSSVAVVAPVVVFSWWLGWPTRPKILHYMEWNLDTVSYVLAVSLGISVVFGALTALATRFYLVFSRFGAETR